MGAKKTKQEETLRDRKKLEKLLFILTKQKKTEQKKKKPTRSRVYFLTVSLCDY